MDYIRKLTSTVCWIWCVVCGWISIIIHYVRKLTSTVYWIWCVVCGWISIIMDYIRKLTSIIRRVWQDTEHHRISFLHFLRSRILFFPVKVHVLVAGKTFQAHETFIQNLKLQIEFCSTENSDVILVFCPVVSRIGTDMEAAMAKVTEDKPVILVFMHHCHSPSHMTNMTVQPCRRNMRVVHCAFLENDGLLQCRENSQAVSEVRMMLQKYQQGNGPSTEEISKSV